MQPFPNLATGTKVVTTAGTKVQLVSAITRCRKLIVTAHKANTKAVTIGDVNVVGAVAGRRGIAIEPGATYTLENLNDLFTIYLDSEVNGEGISYAYQW